MTKMSIHHALTELKLLNKRIDQGLASLNVVAVTQGKGDKEEIVATSQKGYIEKNVADFKKKAKSDYDSILGLIKRKRVIKYAIVRTNAVKQIDIAGQTMTVAEAIALKHDLTQELTLTQSLANQLIHADQWRDKTKQAHQVRVDQRIEAAFPGASSDAKIDTAFISDAFWNEFEVAVIDPIGAATQAKKLGDKLDAFAAEFDQVITTANVTTMIEVADV